MGERKFKVGDKVRLVETTLWRNMNEVGVIIKVNTYVDDDFPYEVHFETADERFGEHNLWFSENNLELIKDSSSKIKNLYSQVLNTKTLDSQIVQLSAEHSELMVELSRLSRNRDDSSYKKIASELVDLEIMVNEFKFYLMEHLKVVNQSEYDSMMEQAINKFDNILNGDK